MVVKIENENNHENEHDWRGQTLAKFFSLLREIKHPKPPYLSTIQPRVSLGSTLGKGSPT
jgi:hypothetical protein